VLARELPILKPNGQAVEASAPLEKRHPWGLSFVARAIGLAAIVGGHARQVGPGVICMVACLLDRGRLQRGWLLVSD
jgi:hypothetical protein